MQNKKRTTTTAKGQHNLKMSKISKQRFISKEDTERANNLMERQLPEAMGKI